MSSDILQPRLIKMLLVNSGRFDFAVIDVDKSMHFHGGNNAGKTTLVNALQFLFVDSFKSMVWAPKKSKETREYYFKTNSYIVFEVSTPTGTQCLVVIGKGAASSNEFERWIYPGSLIPEQYLRDGNKAKDTASVKSYIDSMNGIKIDDTKMRKWLIGKGDSPFGVAPLKRVRDFPKYRNVFTNLLRMKKLSPNDVRELIISSSDIFKEEITLAENFQDEFDRYKGKLQSIQKLDSAKEKLDGFLEAFDDLGFSRGQYFNDYHSMRPTLSNLIDSYRKQIKAAEDDLNAFQNDLDILQQNAEAAREISIKKSTSYSNANSKLKELRIHIEATKSLSELELSARYGTVKRRITELNIALERSGDLNLEGDLSTIVKKLSSLESELSGNTNLKRELIQSMNSYNQDEIGTLIKIFNIEVLDLPQESFKLDESEWSKELIYLMNMIKVNAINSQGLNVDLSSVSSPKLIRSVDELNRDISAYTKKKTRLVAALEAKKNIDLKKEELKTLQKEAIELEANLTSIRELPEKEMSLKSEEQNLIRLKEEMDGAKEKESLIGKEIITLVSKRSDLKNTVVNKSDAVADIEDRLPKIRVPDDNWNLSGEVIIQDHEKIENDIFDWRTAITGLERKASSLRTKESRLWDAAETIHTLTEGQFRDSDLKSIYVKIIAKMDSLTAEKEALKELRESLEEDVKGEIRDFLDSFDQVKKTIRSINRELDGVKISDIDYFKLEEYPINAELRTALESARQQTTLFSFDGKIGKMDLLFERGKIGLRYLFEVAMKVAIGDRVSTLTNIGEGESTGTNLSLLLCVHIAILKHMTSQHRGRLPIFIDEVEKLDDQNLVELVNFCESSGFQVITASPRPTEFIEVNYWLNRNSTVLTKTNKAVWSDSNA